MKSGEERGRGERERREGEERGRGEREVTECRHLFVDE